MPLLGPALAATALLLTSAAGTAPLPALSARERAGRTIYHEGKSPSGGAINAQVGGTTLSAEMVTCVGCHGDDGRGRPEGGVTPTPIVWSELTRPYGRELPSGRRHPAYDDRTAARALTDGVDAGGTALEAVMPRYSMSRVDMESLVAYLKRLGNEPVPGVGPGELRLGTVLPEKGPFAELGRAIRGVLEAWVAEANVSGGIHGRKLVLQVGGYDPAREGGLEAARKLLARGDLLALVSGFTPAVEPELADLAEKEGVPLVGPFTPWPAGEAQARPKVFYLLGGPREHARVLAAHAVKESGPAGVPAVVLHVAEPRHAEAARAGAERLRAGGWTRVELVPFELGRLDAEAVAGLQARGAEVVLYIGEDPDLSSFFRWANAKDFAPRVLASGALTARAALAAPAAFQGRVVLAMTSAPAAETVAGREALARATQRAGVGDGHHAARASAWATALVLGEGLRRAGRGLSRERLISSLEALYAFETGLTPPISYGSVRRIGARGAWLVAADVEAQAFRPLGEWTEAE